MRLIGEFKDEGQAFGFQSSLKKEGIQSLYDSTKDPSGQMLFRLWIVEEDEFEKAWALYQEWQKNPQDARFEPKHEPQIKKSVPHWKVKMVSRRLPTFSFNNLVILICGLIFILNSFQNEKIRQKGEATAQLTFTSLEKKLLFDFPPYFANLEKFLVDYPVKTLAEIKEFPGAEAAFEKAKDFPTWKGFADLFIKRSWKEYEDLPPGSLFGKIREGEVWRLYSPVLLHGSWLHILFNMAWLWMLGRQIEQRIGIFRYLILSLIVGMTSNVAQYLMSGPEFLGYSGIVMGMALFIWMRQKMAPWEGYPLHESVVRFLVIYVAVLLVLEMVSLGLDFFHVTERYANIANTAHISGGLTGLLLARLPFFSRRLK
ncbi:MAG TPA: rhomboid family intramembrane serine protease [Rhabdochlamydiaceae bacterium]|jgi:GlpG protein|nr:rhomboid family intramembrane serine protease [Rhabdochlamydiaceae bacterium]